MLYLHPNIFFEGISFVCISTVEKICGAGLSSELVKAREFPATDTEMTFNLTSVHTTEKNQ